MRLYLDEWRGCKEKMGTGRVMLFGVEDGYSSNEELWALCCDLCSWSIKVAGGLMLIPLSPIRIALLE